MVVGSAKGGDDCPDVLPTSHLLYSLHPNILVVLALQRHLLQKLVAPVLEIAVGEISCRVCGRAWEGWRYRGGLPCSGFGCAIGDGLYCCGRCYCSGRLGRLNRVEGHNARHSEAGSAINVEELHIRYSRDDGAILGLPHRRLAEHVTDMGFR